VRSFTIMTTSANDLLRPLHERMPVILDPADHAAWLGETDAAPETLHALLRPYPAELMRVWPVSNAVNNVRNDEPALLDEAA
jgi:putative SOS response-associated peptidase YedK